MSTENSDVVGIAPSYRATSIYQVFIRGAPDKQKQEDVPLSWIDIPAGVGSGIAGRAQRLFNVLC